MKIVYIDVHFDVVVVGECTFHFRETRYFEQVPSYEDMEKWIRIDSWKELIKDFNKSLPGVEIYSIEQCEAIYTEE